MSLILDALKKSENDRKRQVNPMIADVRVAAEPKKAPTWLWWLIGLLAVNFLVLVVVMLRSSSPPVQPVAATVAPAREISIPEPMPASDIVRAPVRAKEEVRSLSQEVLTPAADRGLGQAVTEATSAPTPAPKNSPVNEPEITDLSMPLFEELRASGALDLPDLHIDLHFYHPDANQRLVYINSRKYSEGETTQEGPRIDSIRQDGAVLNYRGTDFFLPRD